MTCSVSPGTSLARGEVLTLPTKPHFLYQYESKCLSSHGCYHAGSEIRKARSRQAASAYDGKLSDLLTERLPHRKSMLAGDIPDIQRNISDKTRNPGFVAMRPSSMLEQTQLIGQSRNAHGIISSKARVLLLTCFQSISNSFLNIQPFPLRDVKYNISPRLPM